MLFASTSVSMPNVDWWNVLLYWLYSQIGCVHLVATISGPFWKGGYEYGNSGTIVCMPCDRLTAPNWTQSPLPLQLCWFISSTFLTTERNDICLKNLDGLVNYHQNVKFRVEFKSTLLCYIPDWQSYWWFWWQSWHCCLVQHQPSPHHHHQQIVLWNSW